MLTKDEALQRIEHAGKHSQSEVEQAVRECLLGKHGEFAQKTLMAIAKERK